MDIKTLCLGVLSLGEASGYEIKKFFEDGFSHFYVAGFGSIYPALAQLTGEGHVTCSDIEQPPRPAKKVYRITDSGLALFRRELAQGYPAHRVRSDFLLQLVVADFLPPERLDAVLTLRHQDLEAELQHIHDYCRQTPPAPGGQFALGYAQAVLQAGRDYIEQHRGALLVQMRERERE
jgi:PadR family transcriptional regulator AphA